MIISELYSDELNEKIFKECMTLREEGHMVAGIYCAFTPQEILNAAGVIPVYLCAGSSDSAKKSEVHLPRNMCDLVKSSYGHAISDSCPYFHFSDFIIADATCDGKKKMFELLSDLKDVHVLNLPQSYMTESNRVFFKSELEKIVNHVESKTGIEITNEKLNRAIRDYNRFKKAKQRIYELNKADIPLVSGKEISNIVNGISFECNLDKRIKELDDLHGMLSLRQENIEYRESVKGKHRVLLTGCPMSNTKLLDIIESLDAIVVASENCGSLKTIYDLAEEDSDDPLAALTEAYLEVACPCMSPNPKRFEILKDIVENYKIDAVVELTWMGCHTYNVESFMIKRFMKDTLNKPYLQIDTDYSENDKGQLLTRVAAMLERL